MTRVENQPSGPCYTAAAAAAATTTTTTTTTTQTSHAGVVQFVFGCLYVMAKGYSLGGTNIEESTVLKKDYVLDIVMPPACDLDRLGFKYQNKSTGRKLVSKSIRDSAGSGRVIVEFKQAIETLYDRYKSMVETGKA